MYPEWHISKSLPVDYGINRSANYSSQDSDLETLVSVLKSGKKWEKGEMNMMILQINKTKRTVLAVLHEKTEIKSNQINDSITIQVIDGHLKLHFLQESIDLQSGEILNLNEKTRYGIDSVVETAFLMTLVS